MTTLLPLLQAGLGDPAATAGVVAVMLAVCEVVKVALKRRADRSDRNGNGHVHRRHDDTREIELAAREAGATDAKVTALGTDMDRLSAESADTTARLVRVETRLDEIKADVGEIKGSIGTLHRRMDGTRGGKV